MLLVVACALVAHGWRTELRAEDEPQAAPAIPAPAGGRPCQGTLMIAGKNYKLEHVAVYKAKVFDDEGIVVLASSKPIPVDRLKAKLIEGKGTDDKFIFFEPNIHITFKNSGEVMFCNAWADNYSVSISGSRLTGELVVKDGRVRGQAKLELDSDAKLKNSCDLLFDAPLIAVAIPKAEPKPNTTAKAKPKKGSDSTDEPDSDDSDEKPVAAGPKINVHDLPLPKDATDVEYKELVQHMQYKSKTDHKKLAAFLQQRLSAQGWKADGPELLGPMSAILKRKQGAAELTIFVKPAGAGSTVLIMSSGLSWARPAAKDGEGDE
jgi:hypothetical protein